MAGTTGLEPAASAVTGQRSNQLNYVPTRQINEIRNRQCLYRYKLHILRRLPKATRIACISVRTAHKPPINFGDLVRLCCVQNATHRLLRAIQIGNNLGTAANKT